MPQVLRGRLRLFLAPQPGALASGVRKLLRGLGSLLAQASSFLVPG